MPEERRPNTRANKASHHLASGALSGLASAVVLQPLDLVKTRVQQGPRVAASSTLGLGLGIGSGAGAGADDVASSARDMAGRAKGRVIAPAGGVTAAFRQVVLEEGVAGLWRGTIPTVVRNVPGAAAYFYLLSEIRHGMSNIGMFTTSPAYPASSPLSPSAAISSTPTPGLALPPTPTPSASNSSARASQSQNKMSALPTLTTPGNLLAGALARTSVGFVFSPVTVLKARFESNLYSRYTSLGTAFLDLVRTSGLRGLFQGFTATALRDAPYAGIYVVCYEEGKVVAGRLINPDWGVPYAAIHTVSGMSAAAMATLATSPADCIKTRMQVLPEANPSLRAAVRSVYRDRGLLGFLSGASLRISRKAASSAIGWTVYEGILLFMRDRERERERGLVARPA